MGEMRSVKCGTALIENKDEDGMHACMGRE